MSLPSRATLGFLGSLPARPCSVLAAGHAGLAELAHVQRDVQTSSGTCRIPACHRRLCRRSTAPRRNAGLPPKPSRAPAASQRVQRPGAPGPGGMTPAAARS